MKPKATAALTGLAVATAAVVLATSGTSQAAGSKSYAYGLDIVQGGESQVRQPYVESEDGSEQSTGGSIPPEAEPLIAGGILELKAGDDQASVAVTDLTIGGAVAEMPAPLRDAIREFGALCEPAQGAPTFPDDSLTGIPVIGPLLQDLEDAELATICDDLTDGELMNVLELGVVNIECTGDEGRMTVTDVSLLGAPLPLPGDLEPDTALIPENPGLNITLNRQKANPDGSFTVDGLVIGLSDQAEIILGSATCGEPIPTEAAPDPEGPPPAPAPEPVAGNLPVTG